MTRILTFFLLALLPLTVHAEGNVSLTIYSKATPGSIPPEAYRPVPGGGIIYQDANSIPGYATVREQRRMELTGKQSRVLFSDVAAYIDPTTVTFASLSSPGNTRVLEQNYLFDLVSAGKLLERYLGKPITVEQQAGDRTLRYEGTLMSNDGSLILKGSDGKLSSVQSYSNLHFPELPEGLITKPTLMWEIATEKPGTHDVEVSYQTGGLTWWADYNLVFTEGRDAGNGTVDMDAWASIINRSGASYQGAKLKLMAGDVHRAAAPIPPAYPMLAKAEMAADMAGRGFEEKAFFEYHLYTLGRPASLPDNTTKQLELFPAVSGVPVKKEFVYSGGENVDVYLVFNNSKAAGLGMPLPSGRVRVNQRDSADRSLEFIGEDVIKHTPKEQEIRLRLGSAFDVKGERIVKAQRRDENRRFSEEDVEITLHNHKNQAVVVVARVNTGYSGNWKILNTSHPFKRNDAFTADFPLTLQKDQKVTVRYTLRMEW